MTQQFWKYLESLPGLSAVANEWRANLDCHFPAFQTLCLQPSRDLLTRIPCPVGCGCDHFIIQRHDHTGAVAVCCCNPPLCPDIPLTMEEITPLKLDWTRFAYAICHALACSPKIVHVAQLGTLQIGSWSSDGTPVILTINRDPILFRCAAAELAATLSRPFILLAPTSTWLDATTLDILHHVRARFFDLQSHVTLTPQGTLIPIQSPAELFRQFTPEPERPLLKTPPKPRYALRKGLGVWHLTFDYQEAYIRHEKGMFYVYWLLYHPEETPIHAIDLMAKVPEIYRQQLGLPALVNPATGKSEALASGARLQERSLALDDRQAMRALYRKEKELEAILDSESETEPVKAEALRELEQIIDFQKHHAHRSADAAQNASKSVRTAIHRLHFNLLHASARAPALESFARHIHSHILTPTPAYPNKTAGHLTCTQPAGLTWLP